MGLLKLFMAVIVIGILASVFLGEERPKQATKTNLTGSDASTGAAQKIVAPPEKAKTPPKIWHVHSFDGEMDGHKIWNATTDDTHAYGQLSWPANGITAHITVGKDRGELYVVLVFSSAPNLVGGEINNGYTVYRLPISFDGKLDSLTVTQRWGSPNLYASYPGWFIKKMKSAKEVKVNPPWFHQSAMYFRFDVSGLTEALKQFP